MTTSPPSPPPERGKDAAVFCMIAVFIIFVASVIGWRWAGSSREDLAQWLAAFAAGATLVAATIAATFAAGAFRLESERENRYRMDQQRHQAERFAAWYDVVKEDVRLGSADRTWHRSARVIRARNASDLPVTSVSFVLLHNEEPITTHWAAIVPPSSEPINLHLDGDALEALDQLNEFLRDEQLQDYVHNFDIDLTFTDAAGRRWYRRYDGDIHEEHDDVANS